MSNAHTWQFYRIGGFDQVSLSTGEDLANLHTLDQKLWAALSCPVHGLELDPKTLALIDTDKDGRIRVPELLAAIQWAKPYFKDLSVLLSAKDALSLDVFADTPEGRAASASAKRILASLGKSEATTISLSTAADTARLFAATKLNGDGLVTATSTDDPALSALIADVAGVTGGSPDRSGAPGINQAHLDTFLADAAALVAWSEKHDTAEVLTLGGATAAAAAAVSAVRVKVDDYFARTRLAAFDARALGAVNRAETEYLTLAAKDLTITSDEIAAFPLARVAADAPLPLLAGVNPAWGSRLRALHRDAISPAFGADLVSLDEDRWNELKAKVDAYSAHLAAKPGAAVAGLGLEKLRAHLASADALKPAFTTLLAADQALAPEFDAIVNVEKLLRFTRDFRALLNNYVNFLDFYSPELPAVFQAGTLYLDTRATELCIEVAAPTPLAAMSKMFIAYCDLKRADLPPRKIAACFTNGDSDFLFVGRNGIFYDRQGRDWDATITSLAENPISIRQAFFSPYKKFVRMIEEQIAKRAAAAEAASDAKLASAADKTANADKALPAVPGAPKKMDIGTVAAIGIAFGAIGSFLTAIVAKIFGLVWWQYPLVVVGIILVISGPSMLIAWLKLRQRTIGPVLDANGWAINGRIKIGIPFGTKLTTRAVLPKGAKLDINDPYEDKTASRKRRAWTFGILFFLLAAATAFAWYAKVWPFAPEADPAQPAPATAPATPPAAS